MAHYMRGSICESAGMIVLVYFSVCTGSRPSEKTEPLRERYGNEL